MAEFSIPLERADQTHEGQTHCKHGHGVEHQCVNIRGHKICRLCAQAAVAKFKLVHSDKIRARIEAMKVNSAKLAEALRACPICRKIFSQHRMVDYRQGEDRPDILRASAASLIRLAVPNL
jgi:hypothetical protein